MEFVTFVITYAYYKFYWIKLKKRKKHAYINEWIKENFVCGIWIKNVFKYLNNKYKIIKKSLKLSILNLLIGRDYGVVSKLLEEIYCNSRLW